MQSNGSPTCLRGGGWRLIIRDLFFLFGNGDAARQQIIEQGVGGLRETLYNLCKQLLLIGVATGAYQPFDAVGRWELDFEFAKARGHDRLEHLQVLVGGKDVGNESTRHLIRIEVSSFPKLDVLSNLCPVAFHRASPQSYRE